MLSWRECCKLTLHRIDKMPRLDPQCNAACAKSGVRVQQECEVHDMDSVTDYRTLATRALGSYFVRMRDGQTKDERLTSALDTV